MSFNNDATLDIAIEPQHHASLKEKVIGSAQILQSKITGNPDKKASGHMKKYGHLDHTFANDARAKALAKTPESRRDLIRQAEAGQKEFEQGWGDVEGTVAGNPSKEVFDSESSEGLERRESDESVTSTTTTTTTSSPGLEGR